MYNFLSKSEEEFLKKYRQLDADGQNLIDAILDARIAQLKIKRKNTA